MFRAVKTFTLNFRPHWFQRGFPAPTGGQPVIPELARLNVKQFSPIVVPAVPVVAVGPVGLRWCVKGRIDDRPQVDNPAQQDDPQQDGHDKHESSQHPATLQQLSETGYKEAA